LKFYACQLIPINIISFTKELHDKYLFNQTQEYNELSECRKYLLSYGAGDSILSKKDKINNNMYQIKINKLFNKSNQIQNISIPVAPSLASSSSSSSFPSSSSSSFLFQMETFSFSFRILW
jgi:hypothetical protein